MGNMNPFTQSRHLLRCAHAHLVIVGGILCSKLQLSDDDLIRPHPQVSHTFKECFKINIIQSPSRSANQGREHVNIWSKSSFLQENKSEACEAERKHQITSSPSSYR